MTTIGIIGAGAMGAAVGARLVQGGATVLTLLEGRSETTKTRAAQAGMRPASEKELAAADIILSIVPPGEAIGIAHQMAPHLSHSPAIFADCNAISPQTMCRIAEIVVASGARVADAGIIGAPPRQGYDGPVFYTSGPHAERLEVLHQHGLVLKILDGDIGMASGLKMSYGGITKGLTALAAAMMLGATRFGAADAPQAELAHSLAPLLTWFERQVPGMYPKAYRWVAEMQEVADFLADDPASAAAYRAIADLYRRLATDFVGERQEIAALDAFISTGR